MEREALSQSLASWILMIRRFTSFYPWVLLKDHLWPLVLTQKKSFKLTQKIFVIKKQIWECKQIHFNWPNQSNFIDLFRAGVTNLRDPMPDDQRWSWCNNKRNKVIKGTINVMCSNHPKTIPSPQEKLPSMKLVFKKYSVVQSCPILCNPMDCSLQAPLSMEFSRQEYRSGLPFPSPGDLPDPGIEPGTPALQADSLPSEPPEKPMKPVPRAKKVEDSWFRGISLIEWMIWREPCDNQIDANNYDNSYVLCKIWQTRFTLGGIKEVLVVLRIDEVEYLSPR